MRDISLKQLEYSTLNLIFTKNEYGQDHKFTYISLNLLILLGSRSRLASGIVPEFPKCREEKNPMSSTWSNYINKIMLRNIYLYFKPKYIYFCPWWPIPSRDSELDERWSLHFWGNLSECVQETWHHALLYNTTPQYVHWIKQLYLKKLETQCDSATQTAFLIFICLTVLLFYVVQVCICYLANIYFWYLLN